MSLEIPHSLFDFIGSNPNRIRVTSCVDDAVRNPAYDSHKRAKNWAAVVVPNRMAPGGLVRTFLRCRQDFVDVSEAQPGDCIEFGGDRYSARGNAERDRRYYIVVGRRPDLDGEDCLVLLRCSVEPPSARSLAADRAVIEGVTL
jgi:hypothetical protein